MSTFLGRETELATLERELAEVRKSGRGRFVWMRGRRRVGKSRLVQEFCDRTGARYCFYQAPQRPRGEALADFAETVRESSLLASTAFEGAAYDSWPAAMRAAVHGAGALDPVVLVVDELPYLVELDDGFAADLQKAWDRDLEGAPVLVIGVGSDMRMMDALVGERSPLHGRPTREMWIRPLDPAAVAEIAGAVDPGQTLDRYLVVGGFPLLAASWPDRLGFDEFLQTALADDQTPFVTTALRIMASEFAHDVQAVRTIEAIGHGEAAYSRIQSRSGVKGNTLSAALEVLIEGKRLVAKEQPYAVPLGRKAAKYTVVDPYLRFWLRFVGPQMAELSRGRPDLVVERVRRDWDAYRGRAVEPLVREALERLLADPVLSERLGGARQVGSWWRRDHSVEVDLVGGDAVRPAEIGFVGSVKWREAAPFGARDLHELAEARAHVPGAEGAKLVAVSRSGFEPGLGLDATFEPADLLAAW
jgi:AAA+ ATPase superfamily predicted ATPase